MNDHHKLFPRRNFMSIHEERKQIARNKLQIAVENFKQAEIEAAEILAPITYKWAKNKIYENRKIILNPKSNDKQVEAASDDASAAAAQLLSIIRKHDDIEELQAMPHPDFTEKKEVDTFINEGGPDT